MRLAVKGVDTARAQGALPSARARAFGVTAEAVLADCTPFVPIKTGALRFSGKAVSSERSGSVEWGTDAMTARYARVQYYGTRFSHATHANAAGGGQECAHWFEAAQATRQQAWRDTFARAYEGGIHG